MKTQPTDNDEQRMTTKTFWEKTQNFQQTHNDGDQHRSEISIPTNIERYKTKANNHHQKNLFKMWNTENEEIYTNKTTRWLRWWQPTERSEYETRFVWISILVVAKIRTKLNTEPCQGMAVGKLMLIND